MLASLRRRWNLRLLAAFLFGLCAIFAQQDPTSLLTPGVARVGDKLACRCGTCRNTVATCPMLRCHYTEPMRARIKAMEEQGKSDEVILAAIVQEEGVVALAAPPVQGWGLFTWIMPGVALGLGFLLYSWWVRRNRREPVPQLSSTDVALLEKYRDQIERDLDADIVDSSEKGGNRPKR